MAFGILHACKIASRPRFYGFVLVRASPRASVRASACPPAWLPPCPGGQGKGARDETQREVVAEPKEREERQR